MSLARFLLLAVGAWLLWCALAFLLQRRFLYPGASMEPVQARDAETLPGVERLWLPHEGGRAEAWLLPAPGEGPHPAVLYFHGNGEFIDDWVDLLRPFPRELGMSLLLVEYPGYGRSTGRPTRKSILEVATAAWDALAGRPDVDEERMVSFGRSIGGGPAAELAVLRDPAALVLQSTFTDVGVMAARHSGVPPFLIRDRWRPEAAVRAYEGPVLVRHGRRDRIVPFRHGEELGAAREGVVFRPMECGHNDCPPPGAAWWAELRGFLEEAGVLPREAGR